MKRSGGFTLIELMVAVSVASILLVVAIPSLGTLVRSNRSSSDANALLSVLLLARSEAVKRGALVVACKTTDGNSCSTTATDGWHDGVIVFVDDVVTNNSLDAGETVIQRRLPLAGSSTMIGNGTLANYMSYQPNGRGTVNGTITIDPGESEHLRKLTVSPAGRPYVKDG